MNLGNKIVLGMLLVVGAFLLSCEEERRSSYLSFRVAGHGPDLILVPGLASSSEIWDGIVPQLEEKYRVHLVSFSGFAGRRAERAVPESYLEVFVKELKSYIGTSQLEGAVLVGHSMGGLVALLVASEAPEKVCGLVLVDTLPFYSLLLDPNASASAVASRAVFLENQIVRMSGEHFKKLAASSAAVLTKGEDKQKILFEWILLSNRAEYAQVLREVMGCDARPKLDSINCFVRVIYAYDKSMNIPESELDDLFRTSYAGLKDARIRRISGSLHFLMWDQPEAFKKALFEALEGKEK